MEIREMKDKNIWENFLLECEEKTFLDSWNWGEFQEKTKNKIWRFGIFDNDNLVSVALIVKISARRGTFLFVPHAPSVAKARENEPAIKSQILEALSEKLKEVAKDEGASFIRIAPIWQRNEENVKIFKNLGFRPAPIHMHPEITWELDITPSEEELLMGMRKTTRYLIKQAQKNKEIEIIQSNNLEDVETFNELYQKTVARQGFVPFSLNYLKQEFLVFNPDNQPIRQAQGCPERTEGQISVFLGKYRGEIISSGIFVFWQNMAFYHHGASSLEHPKVPVSYLLQWEAIKEAKKRGCKIYNFWGIRPNDNPKHPWAGLTLFKMGFGGYKKEYVKTQDFPLSKKYWLTYIFEKLRKTKRGL